MAIGTEIAATLEDLARVDGKAEIVGGRIVHHLPTGYLPNYVASEIFLSLRAFVRASGRGLACTDNMGFAIRETSSGRRSFSPDVAYFAGLPPRNPMRFLEGPPTFAVEVRGDGDYGPAADRGIATKRADYFEAGTLIVWDVDPIAETILSFKAVAPESPQVFRRGEVAEAEPALPGWRLAVDDLFNEP